MILTVPDFLTESEVQSLRDLAAQGRFVDGSTTGGLAGQAIKRNEQLQFTQDQVTLLNKMVQGAIQRSTDIQFFAWPRRVNTPLISRYVRAWNTAAISTIRSCSAATASRCAPISR
jgi:predicted 2-oxoglutarate/Fe(II)-dependent dioxygenase YbiX